MNSVDRPHWLRHPAYLNKERRTRVVQQRWGTPSRHVVGVRQDRTPTSN